MFQIVLCHCASDQFDTIKQINTDALDGKCCFERSLIPSERIMDIFTLNF